MVVSEATPDAVQPAPWERAEPGQPDAQMESHIILGAIMVGHKARIKQARAMSEIYEKVVGEAAGPTMAPAPGASPLARRRQCTRSSNSSSTLSTSSTSRSDTSRSLRVGGARPLAGAARRTCALARSTSARCVLRLCPSQPDVWPLRPLWIPWRWLALRSCGRASLTGVDALIGGSPRRVQASHTCCMCRLPY